MKAIFISALLIALSHHASADKCQFMVCTQNGVIDLDSTRTCCSTSSGPGQSFDGVQCGPNTFLFGQAVGPTMDEGAMVKCCSKRGPNVGSQCQAQAFTTVEDPEATVPVGAAAAPAVGNTGIQQGIGFAGDIAGAAGSVAGLKGAPKQ
jgi:hypothetical protein